MHRVAEALTKYPVWAEAGLNVCNGDKRHRVAGHLSVGCSAPMHVQQPSNVGQLGRGFVFRFNIVSINGKQLLGDSGLSCSASGV